VTSSTEKKRAQSAGMSAMDLTPHTAKEWIVAFTTALTRNRTTITIAAALFLTSPAGAAARHPLDPLSAGELATIRTILAQSERFSTGTKYEWIQLEEPSKQAVKSFNSISDLPRHASVIAIDFSNGKITRAILDLNAKKIDSLIDLRDSQPGISPADAELVRAIVDSDPNIKSALTRRGLVIPGKVYDSVRVLHFPVGRDPELDQSTSRLVRVLFASDQNAVNDFSPPVSGLMAVLDLYSRRVVRLDDEPGAASAGVPHDVFNLRVHASAPKGRATQKNRKIAGVAIDGNVISWQKWRFRYGFNLREGLVLYQVDFNDAGNRRSILYRASVAEIATAYGDPNKFLSWMEYFEGGEFGLGYLSTNVEAGREVPSGAITLGAVVPDSTKPSFSTRLPGRIYVYERAAGNLLYYRQQNLAFHARATELVIGFVSSIGNYAYGFNWIFKQDGSFRFEAELAGEILTKFVASEDCEICGRLAKGAGPEGEKQTYYSFGDERYGRRVHKRLVGVHHQHWFNLRLDFDIDGADNAVMENNVETATDDMPSDQRRALTISHTVFGKANEAKRHMHEETARTWTIYNPSRLTESRAPAGYALMPMENASTLFSKAGANARAGFTFNHFWVTPYRQGELYAAGTYPNQAKKTNSYALPQYANDESIYNRDIVVWYSLGQTHIVRPEDYPLISNMKVSVEFRPDGFFERNPALDLGRNYK
jgi:primary-amine oxidase